MSIETDWNSKKVFIDTELWYIENFLNEEEINQIMVDANEPTAWYITMRSSSIRNKFIGFDIALDEDGNALFPDSNRDKFLPEKMEIFTKENGIYNRLETVLPKFFIPNAVLQSFWPSEKLENTGAYAWHSEQYDLNGTLLYEKMTGSWSLYLNEDFEGGVLEFYNKPYKIYPKAGMLISIPIGLDFTHRVTPITKGIRHTLYGNCWEDLYDRSISTAEDC